MAEIIPAILTKDNHEFEKTLALIEKRAKWIHFDVLPDTPLVKHFDVDTKVEVHLMVPDPEHVIDDWMSVGADRVIIHSLADKALSYRAMLDVGLAVEFQTPIKNILSLVPYADFIHLMSISEIGSQGHKFEPETFARIKELRQEYPETIISVDGGVNLENAEELFEAGADRLIVGSAIFRAEDPLDALEDFQKICTYHAN